MKSLVSLCVCTMLLSCAHQQQPTEQQQELKTDLIALNLKGKVKKITRYDYYFGEGADSITSGVLVDTYPPIEVTEFNPQGFITSKKYYETEGGAPVAEHNYTYDQHNHLLLIDINDVDLDGKLIHFQNTFTYDDKGQRTSDISTSEGKTLAKITYNTVFTPKGKEVTVNSHSVDDDKIVTKTIEYYNDKGQLLFNGDTLNFQKNYTYNDKGLNSSMVIKDGNGNVEEQNSYTYDQWDNVTILKQLIEGETYQKNINYNYDAQGNIIRRVSNGVIEIFQKYKIEYYN